jgi:hypothetical protein
VGVTPVDKRKKKVFQEEIKTHAKHGAIWVLHHDLDDMKPAWVLDRNRRGDLPSRMN